MKIQNIQPTTLAQFVTVVFCFVVFYFLMSDVWEKFNSGITTTGLRFSDEGEQRKSLPCMTACRRKGFRMTGTHYTEDDFIKQTFNLTEIIADDFKITGLDCVTNVTEVRSIHLGRCYMICFDKKVTTKDRCYLPVRKYDDLMLFIHDPEDVQFIVTGLVTDELPFVDYKPFPGLAAIVIDVLQRRQISLNRPNNICKNYKGGKEEFNQCVQNAVWSKMRDNITCIFPGTELYFPKNVGLPRCRNESKGISSFHYFIKITTLDPQVGCMKHCTRSKYKIFTQIIDKNYWTSLDDSFNVSMFENTSLTAIKFQSLLIEEEVETYVYDFGNFVVALGGNLGLMLGFSCLSVLFSLIQLIFKKVF